jgi:hypothetical protein
MGLFCVNLHLRVENTQAVEAALKRHQVQAYRLVPPRNGWVSLYQERASRQDESWICQLTAILSEELHAPAIAFLVHDSDFACYWLYDDGQREGSYNSCPDYFDGDGEDGPTGGDVDALIRYARPGTTTERLTEILTASPTFAEEIIEGLADALGIDRQRALADYRTSPGGDDGDDDDEEEDGPSRPGPRASGGLAQLASSLAAARGAGQPVSEDPKVTGLVQAAADGDLTRVEALLADGAGLNETASGPLPARAGIPAAPTPAHAALSRMPMTPLLAAVIHKQRPVIERLLDAGADVNRGTPVFGNPVHAAVGAGDVESLRLLLDRGASPDVPNARGQTPLQIIAAGRAFKDQLARTQAQLKALGAKAPPFAAQMAAFKLPLDGWAECEELLKQRGAR